MTEKLEQSVGLVIPTLNAGIHWKKCLDSVRTQSVRPTRLLVVDSASTDGTPAMAAEAGFEVIRISRAEFNHGGTRQWAVEFLNDCELIVFLTQDAILSDNTALLELVRSFADPAVAVAYGRQLPHEWAGPIEAHARIFNYGSVSRKYDSSSRATFGPRSFFCSNSFAAYRRSTLMELGGFRRDLILAEDAEYAARAIGAGYANFYCASAAVFHSHDYKFTEQLARYFDLGVFDARNFWMRAQFGSHSGEGLRFIRSELDYLMHHSKFQIPRALAHTVAKLVGYRLGRLERWLPMTLKRRLSMSPGHWR